MSHASRALFADDARAAARRRLPRIAFDFIDGAAGDETAAAANRATLDAVRLMPRVLSASRHPRLARSLLGSDMALPFGIAPMGMCNLAWPGADLMLAAEAAQRGIPHCVSTSSSTSIEQIRRVAGARAWFQLYVTEGAEAGLALAGRAAEAGYEVLVLTVDVPAMVRRPREVRHGLEMPLRLDPRTVLDFVMHPRWSFATLRAGPPRPANFGERGFNRHGSRVEADWSFLDRLRAAWRGRLVVKGVMWPEDAQRIRAAGADAVYVSNHGGRQLDSAPAAASVLPLVRDAVGPDFPLIFDSGIRSGEDVVRALALGADFVMLGRPLLFAIGADGARGLSVLVGGLARDVADTLTQLGLPGVDAVGPTILADPGCLVRHAGASSRAPIRLGVV